MVPSSSTVYKRLASLISEKRNDCYSKTLLFICCKIGFALLRSAIQCLRGSRSTYKPHNFIKYVDLALILSTAQVHWQCSVHTGYLFCGTLVLYMTYTGIGINGAGASPSSNNNSIINPSFMNIIKLNMLVSYFIQASWHSRWHEHVLE